MKKEKLYSRCQQSLDGGRIDLLTLVLCSTLLRPSLVIFLCNNYFYLKKRDSCVKLECKQTSAQPASIEQRECLAPASVFPDFTTISIKVGKKY